MNTLEFNWKYKDYEIKACPKRLVRFVDNEPNETIDFIKWDWDEDRKKKYCFSIAYFTQDKDGYWCLKIVGDRFWEHVEKGDWMIVMEMLEQAHKTLNALCPMVYDYE